MATSVTRHAGPAGSFAEEATFAFEGRDYTSGGAQLDTQSGRLFAYWQSEDEPRGGFRPGHRFDITGWSGTESIVRAEVVSSWRTPRSWVSSRRYAIRFDLDGYRWSGTSFGPGVCLHAKRGKAIASKTASS